MPVLVEVNVGGETQKAGVTPGDLVDVMRVVREQPALALRGLMTMPPAATDPEESRPYFRRLRELAEAHGLPELSMGTSQDFRVAAEEGATFVRLGSVLWRQ